MAQQDVKAELAMTLQMMFDNPESVFYLDTEGWKHKMHPWSMGMVLCALLCGTWSVKASLRLLR
jgi:hypothetical protein